MIIRKAQIQIIEQYRIEAFKQKLKKHLSEHFPDAVPKDGASWEILFNKGLKDAKLYGLRKEYSIKVYFNAMLCLGSNFDRNVLDYPWALAMLTNIKMRESEKIRILIAETEKELDKPNKENK